MHCLQTDAKIDFVSSKEWEIILANHFHVLMTKELKKGESSLYMTTGCGYCSGRHFNGHLWRASYCTIRLFLR